MARPYETVLILDSSLDESQIEEKLARLKRAIGDGEDGAVTVTHWGKRKLAYPIGRKEQGVYVILRFETEPERLTELERLARIDEQVLRPKGKAEVRARQRLVRPKMLGAPMRPGMRLYRLRIGRLEAETAGAIDRTNQNLQHV